MSLNLVGNNYNGELMPGIAALIAVGANDAAFWDVMPTKGSAVRFKYLDVVTGIDSFESICAITDNSSRSRTMESATLKRLYMQEEMCKDEEWTTDFGNASGGQEAMLPDPIQVEKWATMHSKNMTKYAQNLRWSGDTASGVAALAKHDGIVKKILALNAYNVSTNPTGYQKITTTAVTSSNALQEIGKVIDALPLEVTGHPMCKIAISGHIAKLLIQQCRDTSLTAGLGKIPMPSYNAETAQILDNSYFGVPVYVANGLDATVTNKNVIMAGVFGEGDEGAIKYACTDPNEGATVELKIVEDGDKLRLRSLHAQIVEVIPNASQIAMNL